MTAETFGAIRVALSDARAYDRIGRDPRRGQDVRADARAKARAIRAIVRATLDYYRRRSAA